MKKSDLSQKFTTPFAEYADSQTISQIPLDKPDTGRASMKLGFPIETFTPISAGGSPPNGKDMNGILHELSQTARASEAGILWPFSADFAQRIGGYPAGATVAHPTIQGRFLVCTADGNMNDPNQKIDGWADPMSVFLQPSSLNDYATTQALNNGLSEKLNRSGDTSTGDQILDNGTQPGAWASSPQHIFRIAGKLLRVFGQMTPDGDVQLLVSGDGGNPWAFRPQTGMITSPCGSVLANTWNTDQGVWVTQTFRTTAANGDRISWPHPYTGGKFVAASFTVQDNGSGYVHNVNYLHDSLPDAYGVNVSVTVSSNGNLVQDQNKATIDVFVGGYL